MPMLQQLGRALGLGLPSSDGSAAPGLTDAGLAGAEQQPRLDISRIMELAGIAPDATHVSRAQYDNAIAIAREQGRLAGEAKVIAAAVTAATKAARERLGTILCHPSAKAASGKEMAHFLAFETDMSAEAAITTLVQVPVARQSYLDRFINPKPDLGVDDGSALNDSIDRRLGRMQN
jgi:hypothetical protein